MKSITFPSLAALLCAYLFCGFAYAQQSSTSGQIISVEASQVATVKNAQEASNLIKGWTDKTRAGIQNMIAQEGAVSKEIEASYARMLKTCEIALALKDNAPRFDTSKASIYEKQFQNRIIKLEATRADLNSKIQASLTKINTSQPPNCGLFSTDAIPCQVFKYKTAMQSFLGDSIGYYYEIVIKRYKVYLGIVEKSKEHCVRPDFLNKLSLSDEEHLVAYETKSSQVFGRLINSISSAFINQAAP